MHASLLDSTVLSTGCCCFCCCFFGLGAIGVCLYLGEIMALIAAIQALRRQHRRKSCQDKLWCTKFSTRQPANAAYSLAGVEHRVEPCPRCALMRNCPHQIPMTLPSLVRLPSLPVSCEILRQLLDGLAQLRFLGLQRLARARGEQRRTTCEVAPFCPPPHRSTGRAADAAQRCPWTFPTTPHALRPQRSLACAQISKHFR